jgi:hypothetical protein
MRPDQTRGKMLKLIYQVEKDLSMLQEERRKSSDSFYKQQQEDAL